MGENVNADDALLSGLQTIPGLTDGDTGVSDEETNDNESEDESKVNSQSNEGDQTEAKGDGEKQDGGDESKEDGGESKDKSKEQKPDDSKVDAKGEPLKDDKGNTVARSGAERRIYEKTAKENTRLTDENKTLQAEVSAFKQAGTIGTQLGLNAQEAVQAQQAWAAYKKDPVAVVNALLTDMKEKGINMEGIGSGIDLKAVENLINSKLDPLTKDHQAKEAQQKAYEDAGEILDKFYGTFPEAEMHEKELAQYMQNNPDLSLEAAWNKFSIGIIKLGMDLSKPLAPQLKALDEAEAGEGNKGENKKPSNDTTNPGQTSQKPLPNGKGGNVADLDNPISKVGEFADPSESFSNIAREAIEQAKKNGAKFG